MVNLPVAFIASTSDDLREHREQAAKALAASGFRPLMNEYYESEAPGELDDYLAQVDKADIVVLLVAHRYGWVPDGPSNTEHKSITWLQYEHARELKKGVLALIVDQKYQWPIVNMEAYRLIAERKKTGISQEVERNEEKLAEFKGKLSNDIIIQHFTDPASVRFALMNALSDWRKRNIDPDSSIPLGRSRYLAFVEDQARYTSVSGADQMLLGTDEVYFPLYVEVPEELHLSHPTSASNRIPVEQLIGRNARADLMILGTPGSGKTTFLKRVALELCRNFSGTRPPGLQPFLDPADDRLPILIRALHLDPALHSRDPRKPRKDKDLLPYFLRLQNETAKWGLSDGFFTEVLQSGKCLVMIDGLDEVRYEEQVRLLRIIKNSAEFFSNVQFLVTSQDQVASRHQGGFVTVHLCDFEGAELRRAILHFMRILGLSEAETERSIARIESVLAGHATVLDVAPNPSMLFNLVQSTRNRLPQHRVELYQYALDMLLRTRNSTEGPRRSEAFQRLALTMYSLEGVSRKRIHKSVAVKALSPIFHFYAGADNFLNAETSKGEIIISEGELISFARPWLREVFAARELSLQTQKKLQGLFTRDQTLYSVEMREVVLLLAALLTLSGKRDRVDALIRGSLAHANEAELRAKAECLVQLGAIVSDAALLSYELPIELRDLAGSLSEYLSKESSVKKLEVGLRLRLANVSGQLDFAQPLKQQIELISPLDLIQHAKADPEIEIRDLAVSALTSHYSSNPGVRVALAQIAQHEPVATKKAAIKRTIESWFPTWKRWLSGVDGQDLPPADLERGLRVTQFRLRNIKGFEDTKVVSMRSNCALFLGANAAGKSTIIRSIALALAGVELANQIEPRSQSYLRQGAEKGIIEVSFEPEGSAGDEDEFTIGLSINKGETSFRAVAEHEMSLSLHNCAERLDVLRRRADDKFGFMCAYGPFRTFCDPSSPVPTKEKAWADRIASLFEPQYSVIDPELITNILKGDLGGIRGAPKTLAESTRHAMNEKLHAILPLLSEVLRSPNGNPSLGQELPYRDLSDGYSSLMALLGSLLKHALEQSKWEGDPTQIAGIVLIDEIDAHLHPAWQRRILPDLCKAFPKLQVVATTHSPMVAGSADIGSIRLLRREQGLPEVIADLPSIDGWRADQILTSILFDLTTSRNHQTEDLLRRYADRLAELGPGDPEVMKLGPVVARALQIEGEGKVDRATHELLDGILLERFSNLDDETRRLVLAKAGLVVGKI